VSLSLEIPDDVSQAMRLPPAETKSRLQLELAVSLYAQEILSLGKAAELACISRLELSDALAKRGVPMHYTQEDLSNDLAYARGSQ
jgi:predicted HTH domain antitoxin